MKKLLLISALILSCTNCSETKTPATPAPSITAKPPLDIPRLPDTDEIVWRHPSEAKHDMEKHCFILKFYSDTERENELLDQLLCYEKLIAKINSSYIPVKWDDDFADRNQIGFGINDGFAGLLVVPKRPDGTEIIEIDTSTGDNIPDLDKESEGILDVLMNQSCYNLHGKEDVDKMSHIKIQGL